MSLPILYAHPFSSYCQKALIAFYEKDLPFEYRVLSQDNPATGAEFFALWPIGRFPILKDGDAVWMESSIVIEWADQRSGGARLIPHDPAEALRVRMMDRVFDNYVMTPMQTVVFDRLRPPEAQDAYGVNQARERLDTVYRWLEGELADRTWAAGEDFSLADCAAAPSLFFANWVHPFDDYPQLCAYYARLRARPSVKRAVDEARPYRDFFPGGPPKDRD